MIDIPLFLTVYIAVLAGLGTWQLAEYLTFYRRREEKRTGEIYG